MIKYGNTLLIYVTDEHNKDKENIIFNALVVQTYKIKKHKAY